MKKENRWHWLLGMIGWLLLLAACGTNPIAPAARPATVAVQPTSAPIVTPSSLPAQPASLPTESGTPTAVAPKLTPIVCTANLPATLAQTEGPYYKPNTPERTSLIEPGMTGTKLIVTGYVLTKDCQPIAKAWLDFWQADDKGVYDNAGYRLRGHLFTDENGRYTLETILPGEYPGRTQHIHVKVQAPNGPILTTQIYFPGEPDNARDSIFNPALLADVQDTAEGKVATFNFVVDTK